MFPFLYRSASTLIPALPGPRGKLVQSFEGRRAATPRWIEWASKNRTHRPLVWVHGASVGEHLSAKPVVTRLRTSICGLQVVRSFTSPSVLGWCESLGADQADFLPPENPEEITRVLESVMPDLLVFSRGDMWPVLAQTTARLRIPMAMIGGTVNPDSRRLWPVVRGTLAPVYRSLSWLGAVSKGDAERWATLGAPVSAITVTGDPRHDQVLERHTNLSEQARLRDWASDYTLLVAGSTDERDEVVLLEAFSGMVRTNQYRTRLMLVPHDISTGRIERVQLAAKRLEIAAETWSGEVPSDQSECLIVNRIGLLSDLYAVAQMAYVGGGFSRAGLHAVIEPAALAVPVIAGNKYPRSLDFDLLLQNKGAVALPNSDPAGALQQIWAGWAENAQIRVDAGLRARKTLQEGAADESALALFSLIQRAPTT